MSRRAWGGRRLAVLRRHVVRRHGWRCWLSGPGFCADPRIDPTLTHPHPLSLSLDHVLPAALGGSDDLANLRPAHLRCNQRRRARLASEVKRRGALRAAESNSAELGLEVGRAFSEPAGSGSTATPVPPTTAEKNG